MIKLIFVALAIILAVNFQETFSAKVDVAKEAKKIYMNLPLKIIWVINKYQEDANTIRTQWAKTVAAWSAKYGVILKDTNLASLLAKLFSFVESSQSDVLMEIEQFKNHVTYRAQQNFTACFDKVSKVIAAKPAAIRCWTANSQGVSSTINAAGLEFYEKANSLKATIKANVTSAAKQIHSLAATTQTTVSNLCGNNITCAENYVSVENVLFQTIFVKFLSQS